MSVLSRRSNALLLSLLSLPTLLPASPAVHLDRDRHGHHPWLELNETDVHLYHAPTPPSYFSIDFGSQDPRHPTLIIFHALLMSLAFFVALPIAISMRSARLSSRPWLILIFYSLSAFGWGAATLYHKLTPDMYPQSTHRSHGIPLLLLAFFLFLLDLLLILRRLLAYIRMRDKPPFWSFVVLNKNECSHSPEYTELIPHNPEEIECTTLDRSGKKVLHQPDPEYDQEQRLAEHDDEHTTHWPSIHHHRPHRRQYSMASEQTLFHSDDDLYTSDPQDASNPSLLTRIRTGMFATLERTLVFAAWALFLTGIVTYTGICRGNYINGCLAHLIKGSIFWSYGLITFARFLGSFSKLGWAWNRTTTVGYPTAEFVESFVIFAYGITNTWMERFGANPGDPFTTKQIQHISIAVMFWFAGLIGMAIESKRIRRWLASHTRSTPLLQPTQPSNRYLPSFNPFPALVIGVTGAAMSAHAQTYLFQVQIHALWGFSLLAFAALRCLTYCLIWISPPHTDAPSRPPTEALASFFLTCGGLLFILSDEEVTLAAMRRGRDDVMMFFNFAVAVTCFAFCWTLFIVSLNAWLKTRAHRR